MELELSIESKQSGSRETKRLPIDGRLTLGRGPESPVALEGTGLSREHLAFEQNANRVELMDLSSNGTWLNGRRLEPGKKYPTQSADLIEIPGYAIRCSVPMASPAQANTTIAIPMTAETLKAVGLRGALASVTKLEIWTAVIVLAAVALVIIFLKL